MKINQITPIRYGQSEINKPETDFLPEEEIVIPTKQSQSSTAKILLGAGILATTAAAGITIAKNKKIKKELETALKRVTDAESKIKDAEIVRLLQKYYGLRENEAQEQIRIERTINYPCRELESYLMSTEGLSQQKAQDYIINHGTVDLLRQERGLWKLSPKELLKRIE